MKLSHILEARYVGAHRYFCITWGPATITYFDFGTTTAKSGTYVSPDTIVVVAGSKEQALERAKEFIDRDEQQDWRFKRWQGIPLEVFVQDLNNTDWDFYKPGTQMRRMFETRYYRNRPTTDQVADMYADVKESGIVDRWDRISLGTPRLYEQPVVRIMAAVTLKDERKAVQYVKRFLESNNLPYTELSSEHGYTGWEIEIIYRENKINEARYIGRKLELSDFQVGDKIIITTRTLLSTEKRIAEVRLINHNDLNGITYGPVYHYNVMSSRFMSSGQGHLLLSEVGKHRYGIIDVQIFSRRR